MPRLKTAVNDARAVGKVLKNQYGFQVTTLLDREATRSNIVSQLNRLINGLNENEHLLIYYAGHGYFDNKLKKPIGNLMMLTLLKIQTGLFQIASLQLSIGASLKIFSLWQTVVILVRSLDKGVGWPEFQPQIGNVIWKKC
ncbi:hypothetical protein BGP_3550 [Beggiatoa sp. PS]|nr:hypothetical protein BGP_3550 [Beggiatoa sp. PS]